MSATLSVFTRAAHKTVYGSATATSSSPLLELSVAEKLVEGLRSTDLREGEDTTPVSVRECRFELTLEDVICISTLVSVLSAPITAKDAHIKDSYRSQLLSFVNRCLHSNKWRTSLNAEFHALEMKETDDKQLLCLQSLLASSSSYITASHRDALKKWLMKIRDSKVATLPFSHTIIHAAAKLRIQKVYYTPADTTTSMFYAYLSHFAIEDHPESNTFVVVYIGNFPPDTTNVWKHLISSATSRHPCVLAPLDVTADKLGSQVRFPTVGNL
jgi:hypothetical protein